VQLRVHPRQEPPIQRVARLTMPRLGLPIESGRPPVEHMLAHGRIEIVRRRQHAVEQLGGGAVRFLEVQRFGKTEDQLEALTARETLGIDAAQRGPPRFEVLPVRRLTEALEARPANHKLRAIAGARPDRVAGGADRRVVAPLVVQVTGDDQRVLGRFRRLPRQRSDGDGEQQCCPVIRPHARDRTTTAKSLNPRMFGRASGRRNAILVAMAEPIVIPRASHTISRKQIDADALRVLYRLHQFNHLAYLVGGSVRDLLLERRPKDFDIATSAHPHQVKRLFRNCWIIGRRFRLAHIKFGPKTIEVATFRRQVPAAEAAESPPMEIHGGDVRPPAADDGPPPGVRASDSTDLGARQRREHDTDRLIHRDNTFGTPEEDAFRRDFTINALFYDIATFSVIDYVGGLEDLKAGVIRCIGDPDERFHEDPVRMLRAVVLAARLDFALDPAVQASIAKNRGLIARSAPPRLMEEFYKILRSGAATRAFRDLLEAGLLEPLSPELHQRMGDGLWRALEALDAYRRRFEAPPDTLTNAILVGTLLVPAGLLRPETLRRRGEEQPGPRTPAPPATGLGVLPVARRDVERLRQILALQRRLLDAQALQRGARALAHRHSFAEALTWLEIHGGASDVVALWREALAVPGNRDAELTGDAPPPRRRRRRRRRRYTDPAAPQ